MLTLQILERLIDNEDYVSVFFSGKCTAGDICQEMLDNLENIDTNLQEQEFKLHLGNLRSGGPRHMLHNKKV